MLPELTDDEWLKFLENVITNDGNTVLIKGSKLNDEVLTMCKCHVISEKVIRPLEWKGKFEVTPSFDVIPSKGFAPVEEGGGYEGKSPFDLSIEGGYEYHVAGSHWDGE